MLLTQRLWEAERSLAANEARIVQLDAELQHAHRMRDQDFKAAAELRELLTKHQD